MMELPEGEYKCSAPTINREDPNSCVIQYYQQGLANFFNSFLNEMLTAAMSEPLFNNLRTEHQLGYNVFCQSTMTHGVLGFVVAVESQAKRFRMTKIDEMINVFLKNFEHHLEEITDSKYEDMFTNGIANHSPGDADLVDESSRLWGEIVKQTYMFDRAEVELKSIEKATLKDLVKWYRTTILGKTKRKLSIMVEGCPSYPNCPKGFIHEESQSTASAIIKSLRTCVPNVTRPWITLGSDARTTGTSAEGESVPCDLGHSVAPLKNEGPEYITDIGKFKSELNSFPPHEIIS